MARYALGWVLVALLSLTVGRAQAAPDECLSYRDNPSVAACANKYGYGPAAAGLRPRSSAAQPNTAARSVPAGPGSEFRTVAVIPGGRPAPAKAPEPESPIFEIDTAVLTNTIIAGVIAGSLLILAALGAWRWGSTMTKACPYCGAKMARSSHACRSCFRAV